MAKQVDDPPSPGPFQARDEWRLAFELRLVATKRQLAVVRMLGDELERCLSSAASARMLRAQLAYELTRLADRSLDAAAAIASEAESAEDPSGIHRGDVPKPVEIVM
jgi:hypothetical protein